MSTLILRPNDVSMASSGRAKLPAQAPATFLSSFPQNTVKPWSVDSFHAGNSFLEDLTKAAKRANFERNLKNLGLLPVIRQKFPEELGKHVVKLCFRKVKSKGGVRK